MIELVVAVCLIDQPKQCKDITLNFADQSVSQSQCYMHSQFELARWVGENPNWSISRWRCRTADQVAKL